MSSEGALCVVHGVEATGTCTRCGAFRCGECGPGPMCPGCRSRLGAEVTAEVVAPGVALAVVGGLSVLLGLVGVVLALVRSADTGLASGDGSWSEAQQAGYLVGQWGVRSMSVLGGAVSLLGGIRMVQGRSYPLAVTGAVLALIPFLNLCFCASTCVGIWALIVLGRARVRAVFRAREVAGGPGPRPPRGGAAV